MANKRKYNRRDFVKISSIAGITGLTLPMQSCGEDLFSNNDDGDDSYTSSSSKLDSDVVQTMIDESVKQLTGIDDVGEAWLSLMPGITTGSVVAIKVNCRSSALPTHPEVAYAVASGLGNMVIDGASFPENNIHIYDNFKAYMADSGYTENTSSEGVQCYSETSFASQSYSINGISQHVCSLVHDTADFLINIGVLKNHASMAGATLCMKNHFGTIDSPRNMHLNYGDPYIAALNAIEPIRSKQVLAILDGILGAAEGGPYGAPTFVANKIIMSQDTVAVDALGRELLEEQNSSTVEWATYIDSGVDYDLGTNDPTKMEVIEITNPSSENEVETVAASSGETISRVVIAEDDNASNV